MSLVRTSHGKLQQDEANGKPRSRVRHEARTDEDAGVQREVYSIRSQKTNPMLPTAIHLTHKALLKATASHEPSLYLQLDLRLGRLTLSLQLNLSAALIDGSTPYHTI
ncbi:hypothetical protein LTR35_015903 [Friedmanniomyces endolithicus]|uniref:Uncharacterized protein n=1 Tax=Friedmanniomyces endolithicus TaxID=329885 RepID=A0AAN6F6U4_9PEZI|nr:hypothetical protein LTR35_015903 [Friedmanniomyces endolithicus]KAK0275490.1 hypothetical protein LTS00_015036 [Friedmanniomyces endolithicus]KAK0307322.1 hypothetical protein LTR82_016040 [Friedmanniomyces endolithicus]KAK0979373.1 hypothetical protein LTR54_015642 [Friedmanniomyces endolithicus]